MNAISTRYWGVSAYSINFKFNIPEAEHWYGGPHALAALYIKLCIRNSRKFNIAV